MKVWVVTKGGFYDNDQYVDSIFDSEAKTLDYVREFEVVARDGKTNVPYAFKQTVTMANGYSHYWSYEIETFEVQ